MHSAGLALEDLVAKIIKHVYEKMAPQDAPFIEQFVRSFYANASPEDIAERNIIDLYGAMISCWHFLNAKQNERYKVHVYNPQFEQHGWQSSHTIITVVSHDMPFLVDSIQMWFNTHGFTVHYMLHAGGLKIGSHGQACLFFEINKQSDPAVLIAIKKDLELILNDVTLVIDDWQSMQDKMQSCIMTLEKFVTIQGNEKHVEYLEFLDWINKNHFTYLGYHQLMIDVQNGVTNWHVVPESRLGVLKERKTDIARTTKELPQSASTMIFSSTPVFVGKTKTRATVHRPVNSDFISVKIFDEKQNVIGEHRFVGLYTAAAYNRSPQTIPLLRGKVLQVIERANVPHESHDGKVLLNILENLPRDDLFQATDDDVYNLALGILYLQERQRIRFFARKDLFGRFYSCLVFVPRERFNSQLREKMQDILQTALNGFESSFVTRFSESVLARIHFVIKVNEYTDVNHNFSDIEAKLVDAGRTWQDYFRDTIIEHYGEERGNQLFSRYGNAFPLSYQQDFVARTAVYDVQHMESLSSEKTLAMSFYRPLEDTEGILRFKLYKPESSIPLSDVIPMLECMGLRVINERPHKIETSDGVTVWINDFRMIYDKNHDLDADKFRENFQETFYNIWHGRGENDGFNRLVLGAGLNWREITMLRAYAKYLWQIGFTFSQAYVESALVDNPIITRKIVNLFLLRFDPTLASEGKNSKISNLRREIKSDLESVGNLDEDRILRRYVDVLLATLRTNYFQVDDKGHFKSYLSFKVDPSAVPDMPLPRPMFEIFVYSSRFEGVHLRGAKVARGGIRWSDRREDFRTEVLGLMKAQQVKNAVIVPLGAKGGFVPKCLLQNSTREEILQEGIACYKTFMHGLLDLTDNIKDNSIVVPKNVVRYDADDPYLVVAADKGTATFSDIANSISAEYQFWLGDAFASGGSMGYDHKKMGITAKGAWESVRRHFREVNIDIQMEPFTVVGIGDLAGDVFGNGMILSKCTKLIAAFNHVHIFIDPDPDMEKSFDERLRMFNLPRSSWEDYNLKLISKGGGVFSRKAKSIDVSPEMKKLFSLNKDKIVPNELIRAILKAEVDLLWNGGIGTYVKASYEHNTDVGDRTNDALRINGNELRAKVVGEGGNLGFTQLARIEFALNGGRINTDAIDNSAGVDCSDHEVNIKILLNQIVASGDLTEKQRNKMLSEMTEEVIELVLEDNRGQIAAISFAEAFAAENLELHKRLIEYLEKNGLNRAIEFLPSNEDLINRSQNKQGLTRPEFAILLAYSKTLLKEELLASNLPEDPYISKALYEPVPSLLSEKYHEEMRSHRLHREIITMQVTNNVVNEMGMGFVNRLQDETGATSHEIVRSYTIAREVFKAKQFREAIFALDFMVDAKVQNRMLQELNRLIRRGTRWFLRYCRTGGSISEIIDHFTVPVNVVREGIGLALRGSAKSYVEKFKDELSIAGVPESMAYRAACMSMLFSALDIVEAATTFKMPVEKVIIAYYAVGARLELGWFGEQIKDHPVKNHWEALARAAFRDDLDRQQRSLTVSLLSMEGEAVDIDARLDAWMDKHKVLVERWKYMVADLKACLNREFIMYSVALRELLDLAQVSILEVERGACQAIMIEDEKK